MYIRLTSSNSYQWLEFLKDSGSEELLDRLENKIKHYD